MRSVKAMQYSGLSSSSGVATGPLLAFINGMSRICREEDPDGLVVCWDSRKARWRNKVSASYKGNRSDAPADEFKESPFGLAKEFLALANIAQNEVDGAEADDLIAAYWQRGPAAPDDVTTGHMTIVSSDKDFLQLLAPRVDQVRLSTADTPTDRWTHRRVLQDRGIPPMHLAKSMAMTGDVSDNVIGLRGIGPKKALKLLEANGWDLEKAVAGFPEEDRDRVMTNLDLVDLRVRRDWIGVGPVPVFDPTRVSSSLSEHLVNFLNRYQMQSVLSRYYLGGLWGSDTPVQQRLHQEAPVDTVIDGLAEGRSLP
jgi:DNA polymerase-1